MDGRQLATIRKTIKDLRERANALEAIIGSNSRPPSRRIRVSQKNKTGKAVKGAAPNLGKGDRRGMR